MTNEQTPTPSSTGPDAVGTDDVTPAPTPRRGGTVSRGARATGDAEAGPGATPKPAKPAKDRKAAKEPKAEKTPKAVKEAKAEKEAKPAKEAKTSKPKAPAAAPDGASDVPAGSAAATAAAVPQGDGAPMLGALGDPGDSGAVTATDGSAEATGAGLRVVVAEDEALIRLDLAEMLQGAGYDVVGQAPDGEQAIALVREHRPDLVVLDVKMPVLDGISAAEAIGKERIAPVVMLTAFSDKDLFERARDAGVMAYVVKPFTIDDLRPALDIARSRWTELTALESEIADLGERLETRKAVDRAKGVLMSQLKLSEADAFRWIQKTAMDRRLGMREVAEAVITGLPSKR